MLTKQHIAAELTRMSKVQISDITRAIKDSQKVIALNEVTDLGLGSVRGRGVNSRTALAGIGVAIGPCG